MGLDVIRIRILFTLRLCLRDRVRWKLSLGTLKVGMMACTLKDNGCLDGFVRGLRLRLVWL